MAELTGLSNSEAEELCKPVDAATKVNATEKYFFFQYQQWGTVPNRLTQWQLQLPSTLGFPFPTNHVPH